MTLGLLALAFASGCTRRDSTLAPGGSHAESIDRLWQLMFWASNGVFVLVVAVLILAIFRRSGGDDKQPVRPDVHRVAVRFIAGAVGVTVIILGIFFFATIRTSHAMARTETPGTVTITVTGRQWWWDVLYESRDPRQRIRTANEIHIPVGEPVLLRLRSADVIHSFWIPALNGKRDLIPGRETSLWLEAKRTGVFEGQCAEFCGLQHAHMRVLVVASSREEFEAWQEAQRSPAREPESEQERHGQQVFLNGTCMMCHTIRGTTAGASVAPDLTHLASRRMLAAGVLPNTRGHLAGWILDPQAIKPGNHMPIHAFAAEDFHALLDYLTSLK